MIKRLNIELQILKKIQIAFKIKEKNEKFYLLFYLIDEIEKVILKLI